MRLARRGPTIARVHDELELLRRWRDGDRSAGGVLFERHFEVLARFFRNKVADGGADLIQRTFLEAMTAVANFRGQSTFRAFLLGVANNVLRHHYRSKARRDDRVDFGTVSVFDLSPGANTVVAKRREEMIMLEALRRLPVEHQVVLELYFWEDLSAAEISEIIGAPEGTVRTRIRRAKQLLEELLPQVAATPDEIERTRSGLEDWAKALRATLGKREPAV